MVVTRLSQTILTRLEWAPTYQVQYRVETSRLHRIQSETRVTMLASLTLAGLKKKNLSLTEHPA